jgi:hypothetical protein
MPAVYQIVPTWVCAGQYMQNVLHFKLSEAGSGAPNAHSIALADSFESDILPAWVDAISSSCELRSLRVKRVTGLGGPTNVKLFSAGSAAGGGAATVSSTIEAATLHFPVFLDGKNKTGKIFVGGIPDEGIVDNAISAGERTFLQALIDALGTTLTLSGGLGTANYTIFNPVAGTDAIPSVGGISVYIGTQRRRIHPL